MPLRLTFDDIDMYDEDVSLLKPGCWLNDSCISFCLKVLNKITNCSRVQIMDAAVMSFMMIQISEEEEEFVELRASLELDRCDWLIVPVNDSLSFSERSTHWSVLICNVQLGRMLHFDSCGSSNLYSSLRTGQRVAELLQMSSAPVVLQLRSPQQDNGNDCGVYTLMVVECFLKVMQQNKWSRTSAEDQSLLERELESIVNASISYGDADRFRYRMLEEIASKSALLKG